MQPAATFVNYAYSIKTTQYFRWLYIPLTLIFTRAAREPANNNVCGACHKKVWRPMMWSVRYFCPIVTTFGISQQKSIEVSNIKYQGNLFSGGRVDSCGQTDRKTGVMNLICTFRNYANAFKMSSRLRSNLGAHVQTDWSFLMKAAGSSYARMSPSDFWNTYPYCPGYRTNVQLSSQAQHVQQHFSLPSHGLPTFIALLIHVFRTYYSNRKHLTNIL
jgi:hypothetical protein